LLSVGAALSSALALGFALAVETFPLLLATVGTIPPGKAADPSGNTP
jgi:hypothetical protein